MKYFTHIYTNTSQLLKNELEIKFLNDFEKNQNIVHKICRIYTTNQDEHNDLFQEITIQVWKNYSKFRGEAKFSTWMYRVALNTAISLFRKYLWYKSPHYSYLGKKIFTFIS